MTASPAAAEETGRAAADDDRHPLRQTLTALLVVALFSGYQQSYFTSCFHTTGTRYHVGVAAVAWTVTGPALAAAVATPLLTTLGDRHGHLPVLRATVATVVAGAVLIAVAPDYPLLLTGRVLQGCLAGFLPLMFGLVRHRHRIEATRRAIAYLTGALMLGLLLGSACSSLLLRTAGSAPVLWAPAFGSLAGLALLLRTPSDAEARTTAHPARHVDWPGATMLAVGLVLAVLALHEGPARGWSSPATLCCLGAGLIVLTGWIMAQRRTPEPLVDVRRLFRPRLLAVFTVGICVHFVVIGGQVSYSTYLTLPRGLGLPTSAVGLVLLPAFCAMSMCSALTSRLGRVMGFRRVNVLGAALFVAGSAGLALRHATAVDFATLFALTGAGMGLISGASRILVIDHMQAQETAAGEGLFELLISLGSAVGSTACAAILTTHGGGPRAYETFWTLGAGVALLSLVASLLPPRFPVELD